MALGKSAVLFDRSLETAEEVERIEAMERIMREGRTRAETSDEDSGLLREGEAERQRPDSKQGDKAFEDITDLENEDFVFVF